MHSPRSFLIAALALALACHAVPPVADEDAEKAETWAQMHRTWAAIMAYKKDHGQVPDYLSDLIPRYLPHVGMLISPTEVRTGKHGDFDHVDPKVRNSFCYEFSAQKYRSKTATKRESKELQMMEFGAAIPILRCFIYERVLNIAYSGDAYESAVTWETSPGAKALMTRLGGWPGFVNGEFTALTVIDAESQLPLVDAEVRMTSRICGGFPLPDRTLRTGADGPVRVPLGPAQRPSRQVKFRIMKPGYFSAWETWREGTLPEEAVIGLERGARVGGIVADAAGTPLAGAQITLILAWPDTDGQPTKVAIAAEPAGLDGGWSCDRLPAKFDQVSVEVKHRAGWTTTFESAEKNSPTKVSLAELREGKAELRLRPAAVLQGTVTTADGLPVVGAQVMACPPGLADPMKPGPMKTDAAGHYALPRAEAGKVTVVVIPTVGAPAGGKAEVSSEGASCDLRVGPGRTIRGRLLTDDGEPVSGVQVSFSGWERASLPSARVVAKADADGSFSWTAAPVESVELCFKNAKYFDRCVTVGASAAEALTVRMFRRAPK